MKGRKINPPATTEPAWSSAPHPSPAVWPTGAQFFKLPMLSPADTTQLNKYSSEMTIALLQLSSAPMQF